jgi:hypothetical protein
MLMKNFNQAFSSSQGRTLAYLIIFIVGSGLHELLLRLLHPIIWSAGALILTLSTVVLFTIMGAVFAHERQMVSRVTSAATLFILSFIALKVGHSAVPEAYLLVTALCAAAIGAQKVFHRKIKSLKQTVVCSLLIVLAAFAIVVAFISGVTMVDNITVQQQYDSHAN